MRNKKKYQNFTLAAIVIIFSSNIVFALDASDCLNHTSGVNPVTNGSTTTITTTNNIDSFQWNKFNVGSSETAFFQFTKNGQTAVNYLNPGADASSIFGTIRGSSDFVGNVLLFNPNGITIGTGAQIKDLNSFFASTNQFKGVSGNNVLFEEAANTNALNVGDVNFNNVNNAFFVAPGVMFKAYNAQTKDNFAIKIAGGGSFDTTNNSFSNEIAVKNPVLTSDIQGNIKSKNILLEVNANTDKAVDFHMAANLEANSIVEDEDGSIYLLATNKNSSQGACANFTIDGKISGKSANVDIKADNITLNSEINTSGTSKNGGAINIEGKENFVSEGAKIFADSETKDGGLIKITAPFTKIYNTLISASGKDNGGTIYLGGAEKTKDILKSSIVTGIDPESIIRANGTTKGGNIFLNSTGTTYAYGNYEVLNRGFVEVSSEGALAYISKDINTGGGTILIDPKNITISGLVSTTNPNLDDYTFENFPDADWEIYSGDIANWDGNIILQANNDITVEDSFSGIGTNDLTMQAGRSIHIDLGTEINNFNNINLIANDSSTPYPDSRGSDAAEITISWAYITANNDINISIAENPSTSTKFVSGKITLGGLESGGNLTVKNQGTTDNSSITLFGTLNVAKDLTISTNNGQILQEPSGDVTVNGTTSLTAKRIGSTAASIALDSSGNDFKGIVNIISALNTAITDKNSILLGGTDVGGNLKVISGFSEFGNMGQVTGTGTGINVVGTSTLTALNGGSITLKNEANDFTGAVSATVATTSTADISITDRNALIIDKIVGPNKLTLRAGADPSAVNADITQNEFGFLPNISTKTDGVTTLETNDNGDIILNNIANNIEGFIYINNAKNVKIFNTPETIIFKANILGDMTLSSGHTSAGGSNIIGAVGPIIVGGNTFLSAGVGAPDTDYGNISFMADFKGDVTITQANSAYITGINSLKFKTVNTKDYLYAIANASNTTGLLSDLIVDDAINSTNGLVTLKMYGNSNAGDIIINAPIGAPEIWIENQSLHAGTDVIINDKLTTTSTNPNPLVIASNGGNIINEQGADALNVADFQRWLIYTGSPQGTTLGGLNPEKTYYLSTITSRQPSSVIPYVDSVLYRTGPPSSGGGGGDNGTGGIIAGGVVGGTALGGVSIAAIAPIFLAGLNPGTTVAAKPLYLAAKTAQTEGAATGVAAPPAKTTGNSNLYYDKEKNRIIWVDAEAEPTLVQ